ncbi:hypothetical protein FIBSPDRAFT_1037713 [Athelia psychrophila]|uniref:MARVEL domain-containing protein n=1 Tax=Athelia psychrophila TaxID=1759441 RepID=A0A166U323_9AGAM|nr:hypothetical protein FIBSPDRAFT_1037713 [Fibularhizoctonia sp. CBS 109695]
MTLRAPAPETNLSYIKAHYHPFLFALMSACALAESVLATYLVDRGNEHHTWPSAQYHHILIFSLFSALWTMIFSAAYVLWIIDGAVHILASIASSIIWLLITTIFWGVAAGLMHVTRSGENCDDWDAISRCRQSLTVEALGWTEFALCLLTLTATCCWLHTGKRNPRSSFYEGQSYA